MLAFRSLDPYRALREPDRRRRDEERLSRSEQRTLSKTQNNHLTGKAPYKFESPLLQRRVRGERDFLGIAYVDVRNSRRRRSPRLIAQRQRVPDRKAIVAESRAPGAVVTEIARRA